MTRSGDATSGARELAVFTIWAGRAASMPGSRWVHFASLWWLRSRPGSDSVLAAETAKAAARAR